MALNVSLDPAPFGRINVCGYENLQVTRLADHGVNDAVETVARDLTPHLERQLGYEARPAARGAEPRGAEPRGAEPRGAESRGYSAINTDLQAVNSR